MAEGVALGVAEDGLLRGAWVALEVVAKVVGELGTEGDLDDLSGLAGLAVEVAGAVEV